VDNNVGFFPEWFVAIDSVSRTEFLNGKENSYFACFLGDYLLSKEASFKRLYDQLSKTDKTKLHMNKLGILSEFIYNRGDKKKMLFNETTSKYVGDYLSQYIRSFTNDVENDLLKQILTDISDKIVPIIEDLANKGVILRGVVVS
jgi:hypothetical protein